jgi:hypothetical protein
MAAAGAGAGGSPFIIRNQLQGMWKVTILDAADLTVRDIKLAMEVQRGVPAAETVVVADGGPLPDAALLADFATTSSWVMVIHRPPQRADAAGEHWAENAAGVPAGAGKPQTQVPAQAAAAAATAAAAADDDRGDDGAAAAAARHITVSFFYQGHVVPLQLPLEATVQQVLHDIVAPAFEVAQPERLGIFLECALLPRDSCVADVQEVLRGAQLVPVVHDLVTMRARHMRIPPDAFRTDCHKCQSAGVDAKVRPFCSLCGEAFVSEVVPPIARIRERETNWSSLESLTGKCENPNCAGGEVCFVALLAWSLYWCLPASALRELGVILVAHRVGWSVMGRYARFCWGTRDCSKYTRLLPRDRPEALALATHVGACVCVSVSVSACACVLQSFVDVYFHCVCPGVKDDGSVCNSVLASYSGGRVETLLTSLFRTQYFVRAPRGDDE